MKAKKIRSKIISEALKENFEYALDELLDKVGYGSIQFRPISYSSGTPLYTALIVYEEKEEKDE